MKFLIVLILFISTTIASYFYFKTKNLNYLPGSNGSPITIIQTPEKIVEDVQLPKTSIIFTGDVMLGREVMATSLRFGGYDYPFSKVKDKLLSSDIVFINLENPIIKDCPEHHGGYTFCSPLTSIEGLVNAGVDIANLANNHTLNYGQSGLDSTADALEEENIAVTGLNKLLKYEVSSVVYGFLGFDYVFKPEHLSDIELVRTSGAEVDVLIVQPHWGDEYKSQANLFQRNLAKKFVMNGADVIVGNHPHWVQDLECLDSDGQVVFSALDIFKKDSVCPLGSKPVYYSLGNFVFDQMWSEETKKGGVVELIFEEAEIIDQKASKIYIRNIGQPEFVD